MSKRYSDVQMHYTSLFSQELSKLEPVLRATSCMNPLDGNVIGCLMALRTKIEKRAPERAQRLGELQQMLETIFMARWIKGEVTQLGFRLGHRHVKTINLSSDQDDAETSINVETT